MVDATDFEACYAAVRSRDRRFDGRFVTGVLSTGIFCRPSCPARTPGPDRVRFFPTVAAAQASGLRACRRCRPELAPDLADPTAELAARAMRLIDSGVTDDGAAALAARLHVSERHLRRVLVDVYGAGPGALVRMRRVRLARMLVDQTDLPLSRVAFQAGFGSVRQFNDAFRQTFHASPRDVRRTRTPAGSPAGRPPATPTAGVAAADRTTLRLAVPGPFDPGWVLRWLTLHGTPGRDGVHGATYVRTDDDGREVRYTTDDDGVHIALPPPGRQAAAGPEVADPAAGLAAGTVTGEAAGGMSIGLAAGMAAGLAGDTGDVGGGDLRAAVARARQVFDIDADITAIGEALGADDLLGPLVRSAPGLRIPGAPDPWEGAVRTVVGQQVSAAAAGTFMARLAALTDGPAILHPAEMATCDLEGRIGLTRQRAGAVRALARAVEEGLDLSPAADPTTTDGALRDLPGIGPWTASTITLLVLRHPDAWPTGDVALRRAASRVAGEPLSPAALDRLAQRWRPWRGYAAMWLWHHHLTSPAPGR